MMEFLDPSSIMLLIGGLSGFALFVFAAWYFSSKGGKKNTTSGKEPGGAGRRIAELEKAIADLEKTRQSLHYAAFHDSLTDLPNRAYFTQEVKFLLEKQKALGNFNFAVLFLDLNRFKTVNDSLGHALGDKLIIGIAKRLTTILREVDIVSRFSGDEFAILLNGVADVEEVERYADVIQRKLSAPFTISGRQVFSTVSIGIAISDNRYEDPQEILRDSDIAMYYAKEKGDSYAVFDAGMHAKAVNQLQLETDLRYAIAREEFCLYYQPMINLDTMDLKGFEALIRWNHPKRGVVPPNDFIPISEETGLIMPITLWVLKTACLQTKFWQNTMPQYRDLMISVNLSGKHFSQPDLVEQVWQVLKETDFNPSLLKIEITESAVMENAEAAITILRELKELGIQISIDDFGTGYSSLSYLHRFPINTLKIDRSFVNAMTDASGNGEIVSTIITLARTLGLDVVAEGIETIHQLHQLRILGCHAGQGYLFSRPVPFQDAQKILEEGNQWQNIVPSQPPQMMKPPEIPHLRVIG